MKAMKRVLMGGMMMIAAVMMSSCKMNGGGEMNGHLSYSQEDLKPKAFNEISISTVANVIYTQNDGDKCNVRLDFSGIKDENDLQKLKEKLKVVYRDGGVEIGLTGKVKFSESFNDRNRLKVYITSPDLVKVSMSGIGEFHADAINSDQFEIENSGIGSIYIKDILANKIKVDNEGVGSVYLTKVKGDELNIDNEGVGKVKVDYFEGGKFYLDNEGVGAPEATVNCKTVKATLAGVGGVTLNGKAQYYMKKRSGVGRFNDSGLKASKVMKVSDEDDD